MVNIYSVTYPVFRKLRSLAVAEELSLEYYIRIHLNGKYLTDRFDMCLYGHIEFELEEHYAWFLLKWAQYE